MALESATPATIRQNPKVRSNRLDAAMETENKHYVQSWTMTPPNDSLKWYYWANHLLEKFCHNEYSRQYYPTFGTDFLLHRHQLRAGKEVTLVIWDLSGQVLTSPMLSNCLYGANVVLVVYDITNAASFSKLQDWIAAVRDTQTDSQPNLAIIANKCDMEHQRAISVEKQVKFANDHGLPTHTVSARTGENVTMALQKVCAEVLGLKLTRLEQEASQVVVKAEILVPTHGQTPTYQSTSSSSVCSIQ